MIRNIDCVNKRIAGRTTKEWNADNHDRLKAMWATYGEEHKERKKEYAKAYRDENREKHLEYMRAYRKSKREEKNLPLD